MIRVFIGSEPKTRIMAQVLQYSIRSRTALPVEFILMEGDAWKVPIGLHQGTGFSLRRFMIPEHCGFQGRSIYLDADQIVLSDIAELWKFPDTNPGSPASAVWCTFQNDKYYRRYPGPQTSVMVMDCANCHDWKTERFWNMLRGNEITYPNFMHVTWLKPQPNELPLYWNHFNACKEGWTKLIHFTVEQKQPTYRPDHSFAWLWEQELEAAILANAVSEEDFRYALEHYMKPEEGDRRRSNGIHPHYMKYIPTFKRAQLISKEQA